MKECKLNYSTQTGVWKLWAYCYLMWHVAFHYLFQVFTFRMSPLRYSIICYRLILMIKTLWPNKTLKINGKYRYQLYLPSFPSRSFYHALKKYDPKTKDPGPITVVFSMTKACGYKCPYCYQKEDKGKDLDIDLLKKVAKDMQDIGTCMFDIEGGEPLLRLERLLDLMSAFDDRAELWINTTGDRLTLEKAQQLKAAGLYGVMISLHDSDPKTFEDFTGIEGSFDVAMEAIRIFQQVGVVTAINFCPSADAIKAGRVESLIELATKMKCPLIQVIHAKSSGGWLFNNDDVYSSKDLLSKLVGYHKHYNESKVSNNYPSILFQVFEESPEAFGCTAGGVDRFYLNHTGEVQPCEFLNVSFGNIKDESFKTIFTRMRSYFQKPGEKWLCCTEAHSIAKTIKEKELIQTPIPWEHTKDLIKEWDLGDETKLYKKLKLYDK